MLPKDFRDILSEFNAAGVEYMVVGAYALAAHGKPRATGDIDLWVRPTAANAGRVATALAAFGAPTEQFKPSDFEHPDVVLQIGMPPLRIDVLTAIDGVSFDEAWSATSKIEIDGMNVPIISKAHLVRNKRSTGRPRDLLDADLLEAQE